MSWLRASKNNDFGSTEDGGVLLSALETQDLCLRYDARGKITSINQAYATLLGVEAKATIGTDQSDLLYPDFAKSSDWQSIQAAIKTGEPQRAEILRQDANGDALFLTALLVPVRDASGTFAQVTECAVDMSETKAKLARFEKILNAINSTEAMIEFKNDGTIVTANENFLRATGYELHEIQGRHHRIFMPPEEIETVEYQEYWRSLGQGEANSGEYRRRDKAGNDVWLQASYAPVFDQFGTQTGVVKFAANITDRKIAEAAAQSQLDAISRARPIVEFDLEGKVISANDNFLSLLGARLDNVKGRKFTDIFAAVAGGSTDVNRVWEALLAGQNQNHELRIGYNSGQDIWVLGNLNAILGADGKPFKIVAYTADITGRQTAVTLLAGALRDLAAGDLTTQIHEPLSPEFEELRLDFNGALNKLHDTMRQVTASAGEIHQGTSEIASASDDLSRRTESQASALGESAAALNELTASVTSALGLADEATNLVTRTKDHAESSSAVMREAIQAMDEISESSSKISSIIKMIEDIAFQTNLLALNAGVEAARAGEAGRGFAVVASEVRALAQRSSEAATQISQLISASSEQVNQGVGLVTKTGEALTAIEELVREVTEKVSSMALSSKEQSSALKEVNDAMSQLDSTTQQNAAMFEQTNAATQLLGQEVETLRQNASRFQISAQTDARRSHSAKLAS